MIDPEEFAQRFPAVGVALPADEVAAVAGVSDRQDLADGETLVAQGRDSDALFFVWDGTVDVSVHARGGEQVVASLGVGAVLGDVCLLDPGPATATVRARGGATVLRVDHVALEYLWEDAPAAAADLLGVLNATLAQRVEASLDRLDALPPPEAVDSGEAAALLGVERLLYDTEGVR